MNCGQKLPQMPEEAAPRADAAQTAGANASPDAQPLVAKVAEEPAGDTADIKEEDKKQAAMRIAQAINGEAFAPVPPPAQGGAAAGLQDLEKLVDTSAPPAPPQADLFAAAGTTAQFGAPGAQAGADLSQLADLMDAETAAVVPEERFFFEEEPATAQELARLEKVMGQERKNEPRQAAARQQPQQQARAQQAQPAPRQHRQEAAPPPEAQQLQQPQQPKQRPVPPWVAQQQPEGPRGQTAAAQPAVWQQPQPNAPQQPTVWQQAAAQPAPKQPAPAKSGKRKSSGGATAIKVVLVALLVVVATCATTLLMLYMANRPGKAIDDFTAALQAGNVEKLSTTVRTADILPVPDTEDWLALCAGFEDDAAMTQLKSELQQVSAPDATGLQYGAVRLKSEPLFFFISRYYIELEGVQILAPGAVEGTVLRLGTTEYANGETTPDGMLYSRILPGKYNGALLPPGEYQASSVFVIEAFAYPEYNQIGAGGAGQSATVTVGNCTSDDAVIYVGGVPVAETPVNGVVTIPNVPLGSVIKITLAQDGQQMEASVVFADPAITNLMFGEYTVVGQVSGGASSAAESTPTLDVNQIEGAMQVFYTSYLECINAQGMDPLQLSTEANKERLEKRVVSDANKKNLFQYISVDCDEASMVTGQVDGKPTIEFNMTFTYAYWPRDGSGFVEEAFNHQSVQLVYEEGEWLVNYMVFVDDDDFADHKLADFK